VQGASRGLGLEFVRQLLAEEAPGGRGGGLVVATCRDPANAEELRVLAAKHPSRLHVLPLDVTQQATIDVRDRSSLTPWSGVAFRGDSGEPLHRLAGPSSLRLPSYQHRGGA
jgi:hypothetical protein